MINEEHDVEDSDCGPKLTLVKGSEIEACVDTNGCAGTDGIFRPVIISQDMDFLNLTMLDAQRLLAFLNEAIPYMEGKNWLKQ